MNYFDNSMDRVIQLAKMRALQRAGETLDFISGYTKVSKGRVSRILRGRAWKDAYKALGMRPLKMRPVGRPMNEVVR